MARMLVSTRDEMKVEYWACMLAAMSVLMRVDQMDYSMAEMKAAC